MDVQGGVSMKIERVSLVVPCYNEEASIKEFYKRAGALAVSMAPLQFELIFVNDCSTDATASILDDLADQNPEVRVLHLAQNMGHQIALTAGLDYAQGDVVVTIDADLQHPPELIGDLVRRIEEGFDIVHAQREHRTGENWFKLLTAKLFYYFMRYFSGVRLIENCGDFRAFNRPVLEAVKSFRMHYRFLRGTFIQIGFRQSVLKYDSEARFAGDSKYSFVRMLNLAIDGVLGFSAAPIRLITWISILLWCVSLVHLVKSLIEHFIFKITVPGWTSIVVLMFFFTGLILFCIAIIGSYVGRIFVQGQNIPLYWLRDARNIGPETVTSRSAEIREVKLSQQIIKQQN